MSKIAFPNPDHFPPADAAPCAVCRCLPVSTLTAAEKQELHEQSHFIYSLCSSARPSQALLWLAGRWRRPCALRGASYNWTVSTDPRAGQAGVCPAHL